MTVGIYGIFDAETDECLYVGQSKDITYRWKSHISGLRTKSHSRQDFVLWFEDRDVSDLSFEILEPCEDIDSVKNRLEIQWFNELKPKFYGKKPSMKDRWSLSQSTIDKIKNSDWKNFSLSREEIEDLYEENDFSAIALAEIWSCSQKTVYMRLKRLNIPVASARKTKWEPTLTQCCVCHEYFIPVSKRTQTCSRSCQSRKGNPGTGQSKPSTDTSLLNGNRAYKAGKVASHARWHVSRNIINDDCVLCA